MEMGKELDKTAGKDKRKPSQKGAGGLQFMLSIENSKVIYVRYTTKGMPVNTKPFWAHILRSFEFGEILELE